MKPYTILAFGLGDETYKLNTGTITNGLYYNSSNAKDSMIESDFICLPNSYIKSARCNKTKKTVTKGDYMQYKGENAKIYQIRLKNKRVEICLISSRNSSLGWVSLTSEVFLNPSLTKVSKDHRFKSIEDAIIKSTPPLRLKNFLKTNLPADIDTFILNFLQTYNNVYHTIYVTNEMVQTIARKRRSLGDIFSICRYYYPDCTLDNVISILYKLCKKDIGFRTTVCSTIHKRVFWNNGSPCEGLGHIDSLDEYGNLVKYYLKS